MKYFKILLGCLILAFGVMSCADEAKNEQKEEKIEKEMPKKKTVGEMSFVETSQDMLRSLKAGVATNEHKQKLASASLENLNNELNTDNKKLAFWVNIYNSYIIDILGNTPDLYNDRDEFFKKEQVNIAGETISFDKIEHGIIRNSTMKLSKGYLPKLFPGDYEKTLRVEEKDPRIHFVINCGAKDCPPVYVYNPTTLDSDFDRIAKAYLEKTTSYDAKKKIAKVTPLFQWFTGDWGGKDGVKDFLSNYDIIPLKGEANEDIDLEFIDYDWTLDIDNFGDFSVSQK